MNRRGFLRGILAAGVAPAQLALPVQRVFIPRGLYVWRNGRLLKPGEFKLPPIVRRG